MTETQLRESPVGGARTIRVAPPLRRRLVASSALVLVFVVYTLLVVIWQPFISLDDSLNRNFHVQSWWPVLHIVDHIGQRLLCVTVLFAICGYVSWRHRSLRPVALCVIGVFLENLVVLLGKLALSRGHPLDHNSFFTNGDDYPSGHSANVIVVYGLCYWLLSRYGLATRRARRIFFALVVVFTLVMFTTSLLLRWHWFSDLVAGLMVGGAVLLLVTGVDEWVRFSSPLLQIRRDAAGAVPELSGSPPADLGVDPVHSGDDVAGADPGTRELEVGPAPRPWDIVASLHATQRAEGTANGSAAGTGANGTRASSQNGAQHGRAADGSLSGTRPGSPGVGADRPSRR